MLVNEVFGPTVQGEGPHTGQRCAFVRLANCNLACSWCDTPYSWDWDRFDQSAETHITTPEIVAERVRAMKVSRVILTGGEPMMQQPMIAALVDAMPGVLFDVETNGTITPHPSVEQRVDLFVVSPKLAHSGDPEKKRLKPGPLGRFAALAQQDRAVFKFVVQTGRDVEFVQRFSTEFDVPVDKVWIMPEGADRDTHLARLAALTDVIVASGFNLSTRLHVLAWDTRRAV
jgi:organic radical activating enzyme